MASKRQNNHQMHNGHNNYANSNGHSATNGHSSTTNGHSSTNGHSNGYQEHELATPDMCAYCFEVLDCELNNYGAPSEPNFTNDA